MTPLVQTLVPKPGVADLDEVLTRLQRATVTVPFAAARIDFVADLARALSRRGRGMPETQALAFWMRKAELNRLAADFRKLESDHLLLMPRGTVFHVPPANVDTLFVYSLVLSLLVGNRNIVRLSSRATDQSSLILDTLNDVLGEHPEVAAATTMITYGHDDTVTAAISSACDVRVIWGGDATVVTIRQAPLPPHATELAFPDRFSMAAIGTSAYLDLDLDERHALAEKFFNDAYWFDQLGCSSARLLIWVGEGDTDAAAADFHARLRRIVAEKGYVADTSAAIAKIGQSMRTIIDADVTSYTPYDNNLTVLDVAAFPDVRGEFCGAGLFYQLHADNLFELVPHIRRADQTLATFGIAHDQLREFAIALTGRGIDRIVPFGQALQFDRIWDGHDLLQDFTRKVTID